MPRRFARLNPTAVSLPWGVVGLVCLWLGWAVLVGQVLASPPADSVTRLQGQCFGPIHYQVTVGASLDSERRDTLHEAVQQRLDEINQRMSTYRPDSDVTRFNRTATTDWFSVDRETAALVHRALEISRQTEGAFDITVGPLVAAWRFGAADSDDQAAGFVPPTAEVVDAILDRVGYEKLAVRLDPPALKKSIPNLEIDLSAIAKGYAVDQIAEVVAGRGYASYFVEIGEEVRAAGRHPANRPWICGIEKPLELQRAVDIKVPVVDQSIATSGDYRQFRLIDGRRYSHTIDPRTGYPTDGQVALASISTHDCAEADAWATAAMVLGRDTMETLARTHDLGVHMVSREPDGRFRTFRNSSYPAAMDPPAEGPNWVIMVGATILAFGLALAGMSIGVIFKRKPLSGSCGGLANMPSQDGKSPCELCSNPSQECRELGRGTRAAREAAAKSASPGP